MLSLFSSAKVKKDTEKEHKNGLHTIKELIEKDREFNTKYANEIKTGIKEKASNFSQFVQKLARLAPGNWELRELEEGTFLYHAEYDLGIINLANLSTAGVNVELRDGTTNDGKKVTAFVISQFDFDKFNIFAHKEIVTDLQKQLDAGLLKHSEYIAKVSKLLDLNPEQCRRLTDNELVMKGDTMFRPN